MSSDQDSINSFIIKLWLVNELGEKEQKLSGFIIHVPSGEKRYVNDLQGLIDFIQKHLRLEKKDSLFLRRLKKWFGG